MPRYLTQIKAPRLRLPKGVHRGALDVEAARIVGGDKAGAAELRAQRIEGLSPEEQTASDAAVEERVQGIRQRKEEARTGQQPPSRPPTPRETALGHHRAVSEAVGRDPDSLLPFWDFIFGTPEERARRRAQP